MTVFYEDSGDAANNITTSYSMAPGDSFSGTLDVFGDRDWVAITLMENTRYIISLSGTGNTAVRDPYLYLHDDTGGLSAANDDGGSGLNSRLSFVAGYSGTFYLSAAGFGDSQTGDYTLTVQQDGQYFTGDALDNTLTGTAFNDRMFGLDGRDTLEGLAGDDLLNGGLKGDLLLGGAGNDRLFGGNGFDRLFGGDGNDRLEGGGHRDGLYGGAGNDSLNGGYGDDVLYGQDGDDRLFGGDGDDRLFGGAGSDTLSGGYGGDTLGGGDGDDLFIADENYGGDDFYIGGGGRDTVSYYETYSAELRVSLKNSDNNAGAATGDHLQGIENLTGTDFADIFVGNVAANVLTGRGGNDQLVGLDGEDTLLGNGGDDRLYGGDGADRLEGHDGNDVLRGGNGADILLGGWGNDLFYGGQGHDALRGGGGWDTADYQSSTQGMTLSLAAPAKNSGAAEGDVLKSIEVVIGTFFDDDIRGNSYGNVLRGGNGEDQLRGYSGNDRLLGGNGDDMLTGGTGDDILQGGAGADHFIFNKMHGADTITDFSASQDSLRFAAGTTITVSDDGTDTLVDYGTGTVLLEGQVLLQGDITFDFV